MNRLHYTIFADAATAAAALTALGLGTGVYNRVVRTAGNITTTSTSLVDVTGATITFTTGARPVLVGCSMVTANSGANYNYYNIDVDGTLLCGTDGIGQNMAGAGGDQITSFAVQTAALTAASHTIKMQWKVNAGTGTIYANSGTNFVFWAQEVR